MSTVKKWRPRRRVVMAAVALLLTACASPPAYRQPELTVPAQWQHEPTSAQATGESASHQAWWTRFDDATLNQWVDEVLRRNTNLAMAALKVQRAQLQAGLVASDRWPSVNVKANSSVTRAVDGGATTRSNALSAGVAWEADVWGRLATLKDVADWEAQATEEDRQAATLSLVGTTVGLYWKVAYLNQRVQASDDSLASARKVRDLVQVQYRAGSVSGLEQALADQTLSSQEASHTQWLQQRVEARHALAVLFDGPPSAAMNESLRLPQGVLPLIEAGLPASLLLRRPDLRAAELRLRKAWATVDATRTSYYPTLSLTGSLGGTSTALSDVLSNPVAALGAGLVLPFVQWRDMQRQVAISQTEQAQAVLGFRQAWYQALADTENALSARTQYDAQAQYLSQALTAAQSVDRLTELRWRAGAMPLKAWLDAQEARRLAENSLAQNQLSRLVNLVTLYQALGGAVHNAPHDYRTPP